MHVAYYVYNERFLACTSYYAQLILICIHVYVFLLANLYAKRHVTRQAIYA
jgi:hypothetical protein